LLSNDFAFRLDAKKLVVKNVWTVLSLSFNGNSDAEMASKLHSEHKSKHNECECDVNGCVWVCMCVFAATLTMKYAHKHMYVVVQMTNQSVVWEVHLPLLTFLAVMRCWGELVALLCVVVLANVFLLRVAERDSKRALPLSCLHLLLCVCVLFVSFLVTWMLISYSFGRARTHSNVCSDNKLNPSCFSCFGICVVVAVSVTRNVITTYCFCCCSWLSNVFQSQCRVCENENENVNEGENECGSKE